MFCSSIDDISAVKNKAETKLTAEMWMGGVGSRLWPVSMYIEVSSKDMILVLKDPQICKHLPRWVFTDAVTTT